MGIGISCKSGLNLHLGDLLTNYATNKFDSRRRKKEALNQSTKSKSESSFSIVSTKSNEKLNENFNSRRRNREHLDEHQASQVIYLNLPNNEVLFIEKLNCTLCQTKFLDEDGLKQLNEEQNSIKSKFKNILDNTIENNLNDELEYEQEINDDNCSITTIINTSLTKLDNEDLDFIDNTVKEDEKYFNSNDCIKRLSSIKEEDHHLDEEKNIKDNKETIEKNDSLPRKSSVKVQMRNNLNSPNSIVNYSIKNKRLKKSKLKKDKSLLVSKNKAELDDDSSSDEKLKMIDKKEKDRFLKEMFKLLKREQFKLENYSFMNSISESIEPIRSFSADYINNLNNDQLHSINFVDEFTKTKIKYLSENDLIKFQDDDRSITSLKTELLNLDLIDKELSDRDQLESIVLDNEIEKELNNQQMNNQLVNRFSRMNNTNYSIIFNSKAGLAESIIQNRKSKIMVTKTNKKEDLNKRSLVNNWLSNTKDQQIFYEEDFNQSNSFLTNNQSQFLSLNNTNNCVDSDCKLCKLNEEQINELDSDVFQLINILKTLDEILYEKESQLQKLANQAELSPSHSNLCATKKKKLIKSRANLMKKVNMLKQRGRLGISTLKTEQGKQLITFRDGKSTYHIEIGECK